jgi:hypothetical protein
MTDKMPKQIMKILAILILVATLYSCAVDGVGVYVGEPTPGANESPRPTTIPSRSRLFDAPETFRCWAVRPGSNLYYICQWQRDDGAWCSTVLPYNPPAYVDCDITPDWRDQ